MEPLRAMAIGAPLEDARNLAQRYSRMRHDAESLVRTYWVNRRLGANCFFFIAQGVIV